MIKTIKIFTKAALPPFIYDVFRNIVYLRKNVYRPDWHIITGGLLRGRQIFIDPKDGGWQKDMLEGKYDQFIFDYLIKDNLAGKVIFDIGAHIGYHTLNFAHLVGDNGNVYGFEPNNFNLERINIILTRNTDLSRRIKIIDVAVSDNVGETEMYMTEGVDRGSSSGSFISTASTFFSKERYVEAGFSKIKVKTLSLDKISSLGIKDLPDIIKIDAEGAESAILRGAIKIVRNSRPLILMEIHSIYNMLKTYELLNALNYSVELLKEEIDGRCFIVAHP